MITLLFFNSHILLEFPCPCIELFELYGRVA